MAEFDLINSRVIVLNREMIIFDDPTASVWIPIVEYRMNHAFII